LPSDALDFALDALTAWRLTHLLTADVILNGPRDAIRDRFGPKSKISFMVGCPYCVGVYVGAGVLAARKLFPRGWPLVARGAALAATAALVEEMMMSAGS
jgi:hypothetical protein